MIYISYNQRRHLLKIKGHAGYEEKGKDIICAAVSYGFNTLATVFLDHERNEAFAKPLKLRNTAGAATIEATPKTEFEGLIDHDFYFALRGFSTLAQQYPEYVSVKITTG